MQHILKLLIFFCLTLIATAENQTVSAEAEQLKPLVDAIDNGGLDSVNYYLDNGGKWPRITTDSYASKNEITEQNELVKLSDRLVRLLRDRAEAESSTEINTLEAEAKLFFSLGEKLWGAGGYRNLVVSLLCSELASYRCGKIVILSRGKRMGPERPAIFKVLNSRDMLTLFTSVIPEHNVLSESGFYESLVDESVTGETWLEMLAALRKVELGGTTVGEKFNDSVSFRFDFLGTIVAEENISSLVFHQGWAQVIHESMLPALAMYLRNGGSIETLLNEPVNATKFKEVMEDGIYRFSKTPVMTGRLNGDQLAGLVEGIQSSEGVTEMLFGFKQ